jgi:2-polyprenyl-3-methyl-5-hydroxy-6-metoxy-1,4-benzoquinol methylase
MVAPAQNPSYAGIRADMLALVPEAALGAVLEIGCAAGGTGAALKSARPGVAITGIELDPELARQAGTRLDRVVVGDAQQMLAELEREGARFDLVLCGDVLEHLVDPWAALCSVRRLCPDGWAVVSLPNIAHVSTIASLALRSYWPYRDRGIHDRTHLRFFGRKNLPELFAAAGFEEVRRVTHHRLLERPHRLNELADPLLARLPIVSRLFEYQFLCLLR